MGVRFVLSKFRIEIDTAKRAELHRWRKPLGRGVSTEIHMQVLPAARANHAKVPDDEQNNGGTDEDEWQQDDR